LRDRVPDHDIERLYDVDHPIARAQRGPRRVASHLDPEAPRPGAITRCRPAGSEPSQEMRQEDTCAVDRETVAVEGKTGRGGLLAAQDAALRVRGEDILAA